MVEACSSLVSTDLFVRRCHGHAGSAGIGRLHKLLEQKVNAINPKIRGELLQFFSSPDAPYAMKNNPKAWAQVQEDLAA